MIILIKNKDFIVMFALSHDLREQFNFLLITQDKGRFNNFEELTSYSEAPLCSRVTAVVNLPASYNNCFQMSHGINNYRQANYAYSVTDTSRNEANSINFHVKLEEVLLDEKRPLIALKKQIDHSNKLWDFIYKKGLEIEFFEHNQKGGCNGF